MKLKTATLSLLFMILSCESSIQNKEDFKVKEVHIEKGINFEKSSADEIVNPKTILPTELKNIKSRLKAVIDSEFIFGMFLVRGENASAPVGYTKINVDLNRRAGGEYIFLCYTKDPYFAPSDAKKDASGKVLPITNFTVKFEKYPTLPWGYSHVKNDYGLKLDLNKGAGGSYVYLLETRDPQQSRRSGSPLKEIDVINSSSYNVQPTKQYHERDNSDLNKGAGGDYIFITYRYN